MTDTDIFAEMERDAAGGEFQRAPTDAEQSRLTTLGLELVSIDQRLEKYEKVRAELLARKMQIQMSELVDAMVDAGTDVIGLGDQGVDLKLDDYFKAGLPKPGDKDTPEEAAHKLQLREQGLQFLLSEEGCPEIVATTIVISLPAGSTEKARQICDALTSTQGFGVDAARVSVDEGVHWATLTSWLKEQVRVKKREPSTLPLEALGATIGRIVKIVKRKANR